MPLLLLLIVIPVTELYLLLTLGSLIGAGWTIMIILMTALIGMSLLRSQGLATLFRANQRVQQGEIPLKELAEGFLLALAGAFLITPGLLTDTIGFSLLVPALRGGLASRVGKFLQGQAVNLHQTSSFGQQDAANSQGPSRSEFGTPFVTRFGSANSRSSRNHDDSHPGNVFEGEYHHSGDDEKK